MKFVLKVSDQLNSLVGEMYDGWFPVRLFDFVGLVDAIEKLFVSVVVSVWASPISEVVMCGH